MTMGQLRRAERALRELEEIESEVGERWADSEFDYLANARSLIRYALQHPREAAVASVRLVEAS